MTSNMKNLLAYSVTLAVLFSTFPTAQAASLKLLAYNLWGAPFSAKKVRERFPEVAAKLKTLDVDIVALEEVFSGCFIPNELKIILKGSQFPYYARGAGPHGFPKCVDSGVLVLSRYPIVKSEELKYTKCAGTDCFSRKGVLYVRVTVPTIGDVDVYATHSNAGESHSEVRVSQMSQVVDFIGLHSGDGQRPVIFMGDLNATSETPEIDMLRTRVGLRDTHEEYVSTHTVTPLEHDGFTIDPTRNLNVSQKAGQPHERIDYIFVRDAHGSTVPSTVSAAHLMFEEPGYRDRPLSDHFGIRSQIEI
jgi:endonuclease/exonuclease/phosphatase family metal-dependent hydrolase